MGFGLAPNLVIAQCAPGIPSAGNPGCIPPTQPNSPYYQGNNTPAPTDAPQPTPVWEDRFGAVAYDMDGGQAGASTNKVSEARATSGALSICSEDGGKKCKVILNFKNQCAAIAIPDNGAYVSSATASDDDEAVSRVMDRCTKSGQNCVVTYHDCSLPIRVQ
jgi:hypothetical protein